MGPTLEPGPGFSFEAQRLVEPFGPLAMAALRSGGPRARGVSSRVRSGTVRDPLRACPRARLAADRAAATREVVREVARRLGYRASFAPMADPEGVGNGVHVHMSFVDPEDGR